MNLDARGIYSFLGFRFHVTPQSYSKRLVGQNSWMACFAGKSTGQGIDL